MVASGHSATPSATVELKSEVGDILFEKLFKVMTFLTNRLPGLLFLQKKQHRFGYASRSIHFPFLFQATQHADNTYSNNNELLLNPADILLQRV